MNRKSVPYLFKIEDVIKQLDGDGLLLAATNDKGNSNLMTIGWGSIGILWGRPVFTVLVRPSRYTFGFIEASGEFSVNVPTPEMNDYVQMCGSKSGRNVDKIRDFNISVTPGKTIKSITLDACPMVYECRVIQKLDVSAESLKMEPSLRAALYANGDFHRLYFGEIKGTFASQ